jgi:hypothetical protein
MSIAESIFGIAAPAFEVDGNKIELSHAVVLSEVFDDGLIEHESIINGFREWDNIGDHYEINLQIYLYKYADPQITYLQLKSYHRILVDKFYRRSDGQAFRNSNNDFIQFRFDQLIPDIIESKGEYLDILRLKFISADILEYSSALKETGS